MKILAIDDNKDIITLLNMALKAFGHEVTTSLEAKEGLDKIRQNQYDVVLLDLAMPNFSGTDVIDALEKDGLINKSKIILFTASSITDNEIEKLLKRGVSGCIKKPIEVEILQEEINKIIEHD